MKARLTILLSVCVLAWGSLAHCGQIQDLIVFNHVAKLKALLEANPNLVNCKDSDGWTPLHYAIFSNNKDIIKLLLANHAKPSIQDSAAMGDLGRVKALLKANPDLVNTKNSHGYTALQYAVFRGHRNVVAFLLAHKAEVNGEQGAGNTPLMEAAWNGNKDIVQLLLTNNADVNARDADGLTALHIAVVQRELDVVKVLLSHKADVDAKGNDGITGGMTPLHKAAECGYGDVVKVLLANGANINAKDDKGETPLNLAILYGHTNTAKILRQHGAKAATLVTPHQANSFPDDETWTNFIATVDQLEWSQADDGAAFKRAQKILGLEDHGMQLEGRLFVARGNRSMAFPHPFPRPRHPEDQKLLCAGDLFGNGKTEYVLGCGWFGPMGGFVCVYNNAMRKIAEVSCDDVFKIQLEDVIGDGGLEILCWQDYHNGTDGWRRYLTIYRLSTDHRLVPIWEGSTYWLSVAGGIDVTKHTIQIIRHPGKPAVIESEWISSRGTHEDTEAGTSYSYQQTPDKVTRFEWNPISQKFEPSQTTR